MREDMYFRLSDVVIHMPPLRERREDIPLLVDHFNYNYSKKVGREPEPVSKDLLHKMMQQSWPGNVRELAARVKKFVATRSPDVLLQDMDRRGLDGGVQAGGLVEAGPAHPATGTRPARPAPDGNDGVDKARRFVPLKEATRRAVETTERALIEEALRYTLWNRRKAARLLEISYSSLLRRIEAYNIGRDGD
jgi:two-component system response regulator AtoC